jgi:hypothetical protein
LVDLAIAGCAPVDLGRGHRCGFWQSLGS